jgi:peroxiredoxin
MSNLLNRFAPDFFLPAVGGGRVSLNDFRGQILVINFWSAECQWSRRADVALVYRQLSWEPKGVRIVGIASNSNEQEGQIRAEAQARHIKYPVLCDLDQSIATLYQAKTTPHFFVLDRQGYVRYCGALDDVTRKGQKPSTIYLDEAVSALLANHPPNPLTTAPFGSPLAYRLAQPPEPAAPEKPAAAPPTTKVARQAPPDTAPVFDTPAAPSQPPPGKPAK